MAHVSSCSRFRNRVFFLFLLSNFLSVVPTLEVHPRLGVKVLEIRVELRLQYKNGLEWVFCL